jgi:virginiamycin B lyase
MRRCCLQAIAFGLLLLNAAVSHAVTFTEYPVPTPGSSPNEIAAGPDGALWFTEQVGNNIGRITTAGTITEFPIPTADSQPAGITVGPDGAMWFCEFSANKIGRITTAGVISEFSVSINPPLSGNTSPYQITTGPDGALWFSEFGDESLGRITTDGVLSGGAFSDIQPCSPITGDCAQPAGITTGPDGALWFTEWNENAIGQITTDGTLTEYPLPITFGGLPFSIVVGPDGALWFTSHNAIGRITTTGTITGYQTFPFFITPGPDGALWFTEQGAISNAIGRITTSGVINEYTIPTSASDPEGIASGPDGALWFTEASANKIGRADPPKTVYLIHGIGESSAQMAGLAASLEDPTYGIDQSRFTIDAGFNYPCAAKPRCAETCTIEAGAQALANYIEKQNPTGDIILIGYSLGGLIARDMILNNYDGVLNDNLGVAALVTLGTPNLGYPFTKIDNNFQCGTLNEEMAGDLRAPFSKKKKSATYRQFFPEDFSDQDGNTIAALSTYLWNLNSNWSNAEFLPSAWLAVAGGICDQPVRTVPLTALGCTNENPLSDGVGCAQSALYSTAVLGQSLPDGPNRSIVEPKYAHVGGRLFLFCQAYLKKKPFLSLANPPTNGDVIAEIKAVLDNLP